jgi:hypothetical protein
VRKIAKPGVTNFKAEDDLPLEFCKLFLPPSSPTVQMAKKRVKKRTHVRTVENASDSKVPKSFVIRSGRTILDPLSSVFSQLVLDFRKIMEPNTASQLRVTLNTRPNMLTHVGETCK